MKMASKEPQENKGEVIMIFQLLQDGKIVGYERHALCCGTISIMHAKSLNHIWKFIYPDYKNWIPHNSKTRVTGE